MTVTLLRNASGVAVGAEPVQALMVGEQQVWPVVPPTYRDVVLADNPLGYWRLGEQSGTVANDEIGNHPGTYMPPVTLGVQGAINDPDTAIDLNGTTGFVNIPMTSSMDPAAFSVEVWMNLRASTGYRTFAARWGTGNGWWWFGTVGTNFALYVGPSALSIGTIPVPMHWDHCVLTYDDPQARLYVNGALAGTDTRAGIRSTGQLPITLGRQTTGTPYAWDGQLDEVAFYDYALSPQQVAAHYEAVVPRQPPPAPELSYDELVLADNPLYYWPLDDPDPQIAPWGQWAVGTDVRNLVGDPGWLYQGTSTDHVFRGSVTAVPGIGDGSTALEFVSWGWVIVPRKEGGPVPLWGAYTLEIWARPRPAPSEEPTLTQILAFAAEWTNLWWARKPFSVSPSPPPDHWVMGVWTDEDDWSWGHEFVGPPVVFDEWRHLVVTYEPGVKFSLYIDGALAGTRPDMGAQVPDDWYPEIGEVSDVFHYAASNWSGTLAKLAIYEHVLTPQQIAAHYAAVGGS